MGESLVHFYDLLECSIEEILLQKIVESKLRVVVEAAHHSKDQMMLQLLRLCYLKLIMDAWSVSMESMYPFEDFVHDDQEVVV